MHCKAGRSDAEVMQLQMENEPCPKYVGLTAAELAHKLGINHNALSLSDLSTDLTNAQWEALTDIIKTNGKSCETCWYSFINEKFAGERSEFLQSLR